MCATRLFRISAAKIGPNRFHQNRIVSWLMSIPRSASRSSTLRSDSGYLTYIITTRRITSGELLKYRNGFHHTVPIVEQSPPLAAETDFMVRRMLHLKLEVPVVCDQYPPFSLQLPGPII